MGSVLIAEIIRLEESIQGTIGVLKINKEVFCFTLEPPDHENERNKSSIPTGQYTCRPWQSHRHGDTWAVTDVYRRSGILFHAGNVVGNTSGCILLGDTVGKLAGNRAVLNSGNTFVKFLEAMRDEDEFYLTVSEVY